MNKLLPLLLLIGISFKVSAQSACTPDSTVFPKGTGFGIRPDTLNANANVSYNETLQFKFPKDTSYFGSAVIIDSVRIESVNHFPKSFSYQCGAKNCLYLGGSYGCATITGNPVNGDVGNDTLMIHYTVYMHSTLITGEIPLLDSGAMILKIHAHSGIFYEAINHHFELSQNYPNPFSRSTEIMFNSQATQNGYLIARNELGEIVYSKQIQCTRGSNMIRFERNGLPQGIYLFSIQAGDNMVTRRMVIKD